MSSSTSRWLILALLAVAGFVGILGEGSASRRRAARRPEQADSRAGRPGTAKASDGAQTDGNGALLFDGFEQAARLPDQPAAWYYVRQAGLRAEPGAPHGKNCLVFHNELPGRDSQAQRTLAVDGRRVRQLQISAWVRVRHVAPGQFLDQRPALALVFYDAERQTLGRESLGPWFGTSGWTQVQGQVYVPLESRLVVIGLGLFGATGELACDALAIKPAAANPSVLPAP